MREMEKLCKVIEDELHKISEKGLNTGNLDTAYKLVDMYKDLKNTEYWDVKSDYYMETMSGGYSERGRKRDKMGRYSRDDGMRSEHYNRGYSMDGGWHSGSDWYGEYMDSKHDYRASGNAPECKQRLMNTLENYMDDFSRKMEEMLRDSDCAEERNTIKRYLEKIKNLT